MDIRDRVMGDQPNDFLHSIASKIPGYTGYVDKERRRNADKLLRTELARHYSAQRDRMNRVQQGLVRGHHFESIAEVDRVVGVFQRFIDRLNTATYGYAGLFGPVKVEAADLDQIYAFDMALADGVDKVSAAIDALETAATPGSGTGTPELPAAVGRLASVVDDLNTRLNQRSDFLTSGRKLPETEYKAMVSNASQPPSGVAGMPTMQSGPNQSGTGYAQPQTGYEQPGAGYGQAQGGYQPSTYTPSQGGYNPQGSGAAGTEYRPGSSYMQPQGGTHNLGGSMTSDAGNTDTGGVPTTNLNMQTDIPTTPGMGQMVNEGATTHGDMDAPTGMGNQAVANPTSGVEAPESGIETASSPSHSTDPGSPAQNLSDGLSMSTGGGSPERPGTLPDAGGAPGTGGSLSN